MEKPTALYRYVDERGFVSKLYTMSGLKQVIRKYDKWESEWVERNGKPSGYYDTSQWIIERIPIKVDRYQSVSIFLEEKTPKVYWEFHIPEINFVRAYLRATRKSAWLAFSEDVKKEYPLIDMDTVSYSERMSDINVK